jgi:hypothetical protein
MLKPKCTQNSGCTHIHQRSQKCLNLVCLSESWKLLTALIPLQAPITYLHKPTQTTCLDHSISTKSMRGVKTWVSSQAAYFYDASRKELIPGYKCLNSGRDSDEKWFKYVQFFFFISCSIGGSPDITYQTALVKLSEGQPIIKKRGGLPSYTNVIFVQSPFLWTRCAEHKTPSTHKSALASPVTAFDQSVSFTCWLTAT